MAREKISKRAFDKRVRRRLAKGKSGNQIIRELRDAGIQVNEGRVRQLRSNQPTYVSDRDLTRRYLYHGEITITFDDGSSQIFPANFGADRFIAPARQRAEFNRIAEQIVQTYAMQYSLQTDDIDVDLGGVETNG